jgi:hypothetical protein
MAFYEYFFSYLNEIYGAAINLIILIKEKYLIVKEKILSGELYDKIDEVLTDIRGDNFFTYTLTEKKTEVEKKTEIEVIQNKKDL